MWELFEAYRKEAKSKPFIVTDWVGGMGMQVDRKKERPLTMEGFSIFCYDKISQIKDYFANTDGRYADYIPICSRIKETIREDQIGGGMAGIYNPSITQRLNNLVEKTQTDVKVEQGLFPDVNPS
jgi:hypothetical protein